jgi:hypothetical protein
LATETTLPVPRPPQSEYENEIAVKTIEENPHLFPIVTPINVDRFQELLATHPNQPYVQSVCTALREGFWPWADTHTGEYPLTHDHSRRLLNSDKERAFLREQRDHEIKMGRYSASKICFKHDHRVS